MKRPDYFASSFDVYLYSLYACKHKELIEMIKNHISFKRLNHCMRVAQSSIHFAQRFSSNTEYAFLAGIAHDMCREKDNATLSKMVSAIEKSSTKCENKISLLLHGRAVRVLLEETYPLPQFVYDAIETHTLGQPNATTLQKIIYLSDALDYERSIWIGKENIYSDIYNNTSLNLAILQLITYFKTKFSTIHMITQEMYDSIKRKI